MNDAVITLIAAVVAVFVLIRLRSVLGRRTGSEQQRANPFERATEPSAPRDRAGAVDALPPSIPAGEPRSLAAALGDLKRLDPGFDEPEFLKGARAAFEWVVGAFASGDMGRVSGFVAPSVLANFQGAVDQRVASGETLSLEIRRFLDVDIVESWIEGSVAHLSVRFVTEQVKAVRDKDGGVVDGDATQPVEVIDTWTFRRDTRASDPNWQLVATRAA